MKEYLVKVRMSIVLCVVCISTCIGIYMYFNKEVTISYEGISYITNTFSRNIKDLLKEEGIEYDDDDIVTPSLESKISNNMNIKVIKVEKKLEAEYKTIDHEIKVIEDDSLEKGKKKKTQKGEDGEEEFLYELTYYDGVIVEKELKKQSVAKVSIDEIISKGTKVIEPKEKDIEVINVASNDTKVASVSAKKSNGNHMTVESTAYASGNITATGTKPRWGVIAVDPNVIPYGTKVYIPQFDMTFIAEDTGGAIKGNKIDIYMNSQSQAIDWGRRHIDIYIQ